MLEKLDSKEVRVLKIVILVLCVCCYFFGLLVGVIFEVITFECNCSLPSTYDYEYNYTNITGFHEYVLNISKNG